MRRCSKLLSSTQRSMMHLLACSHNGHKCTDTVQSSFLHIHRPRLPLLQSLLIVLPTTPYHDAHTISCAYLEISFPFPPLPLLAIAFSASVRAPPRLWPCFTCQLWDLPARLVETRPGVDSDPTHGYSHFKLAIPKTCLTPRLSKVWLLCPT